MQEFYKTITILHIFVLLILTNNTALAQDYPTDTAEINQLIDSVSNYYKNDFEKSLEIFQNTLERSEAINYQKGVILSEYRLGTTYFGIGEPKESYEHLNRAHTLATELGDKSLIVRVSMSRIRLDLGKRNQQNALVELENIRPMVFESSDTGRMIDWYCLQARAVESKSDIAAAMKLTDSAFSLNSLFKDQGREAVINYTLGGVFFQQGNYAKAREYFQKAIDYYEEVGDKSLLLTLYTNMMMSYQGEKDYGNAMEYLDRKAKIQEELGSKIGIVATAESKAHLLVDMGQFEKARVQTEYVLQLNREYNMDSTHALYWMGIIHRGLNKYDEAAAYMMRAFTVALGQDNYGKCTFYAHALYQTYYWKDKFGDAVEWYKIHIQYRDSIYSERQRKQIEVYTAKFEAAENEKEILRLEKQAEIDSLKRNRIIGISISGMIIGLMTIIFLLYRNRRNKLILKNEKALAESKRMEAELKHDLLQKEFDMKNQELASGMLQIAKKNEFLISLREKIDEKVVEDPSLKILQRKIQGEINSEEDWDIFIRSFRDVHPSYISKLGEISTGLSKSETKLACLLKMNLSSKDIANMLNISSEGIKKARYRLRKKLSLETDVDLHEYLIGLG